MEKNHVEKHKPSVADIITLLRIAGTLLLIFIQPLSTVFLIVYAFTGLTDVLDGWVARKTKTAGDFGARLDSIADLMFYALMLFKIFPMFLNELPGDVWYAAAVAFVVRIAAYIFAAVKYGKFASMHTYLNKLTGAAVFFIPFLIITNFAALYCRIVCLIALIASVEELLIHILTPTYSANTKSIFQREHRMSKN